MLLDVHGFHRPPESAYTDNESPSEFLGCFQRLDVQRLLGDEVFQPTVLVLELFEPLHLTQLHPAELRLPAVVRLLGNPVRSTEIGHLAPLRLP